MRLQSADMTVRKLTSILEESDPDAKVAIIIQEHPLLLSSEIEEGVCTDSFPHGVLYLKINE